MTFEEIIQVLSEISSKSENDENSNQIIMENTDLNWKIDVIRKIGAPWSWVYQFVDHYLPYSRSYNFFECQHERKDTESLEKLEALNFRAPNIPGVGAAVPVDVMDSFINFMQKKAMENDGMVSLKHFKEENCPRMC